MIFLTVILFIIGICVGSFLNVLIDRLPRGEPIVRKRSHCEACGKTLSTIDLIPLVSFLYLRGKCRYCKKSLSWYYPIVELTTGILFVLIAFYINIITVINIITIIEAIYYLFIVSSLIVVFFTDLKYGIIPDKIIYPAIFVSFLFFLVFFSKESWLHFVQPATFEEGFINHLFSGFGAFLFFLVLLAATRGRGMGFGDVKFVFLEGLLLGFPNIIIGLYVAFLTGALVGIILVLWGKKRFKGATIPFGPFLVVGTVVSLFWGDILWQQLLMVLL